jgi:hypothetical protein
MANELQRVYSQALKGTANNAGLPDTLAKIVAAQSQHETGNYTSSVYLNSNNGFGYGFDNSEYQTGNYKQYATYANIEDSTSEIVDYIYRRVADGSFPKDLSTITTAEQYATLLKNAKPGSYYGDSLSNYAKGIANFLSTDVFLPVENFAANNPGLGGLILIGVGLLVWYLLK